MKISPIIVSEYFRKSWSSVSLLRSQTLKPATKSKPLPKSRRIFFPKQKKTQSQLSIQFIIKPDSLLKLAWDIACIIISIFHGFFIPYFLVFSFTLPSNLLLALETSNMLLIFDILLSFNTSFYNEGKLTTNRRKIIYFYFKSFLLIDLTCFIPFQLLIIENISASHLKFPSHLLLLKLFRLFHIKKIFFTIEDHWSSRTAVYITRWVKFILLLSLSGHWLCCFMQYFFLLSLEYSYIDWNRVSEFLYDRYIRQLFIIIETMTSVGYMAPTQNFSYPLIGPIVSMFIESLIFAFTLGEIQSIISKYNENSDVTKDLISKLKLLLEKKKIPKQLQRRVVRYVHYMRELEEINMHKEVDLLASLSKPLKIEIFTFTRSSYLRKHAVFQNHSQDFLKFIGFSMHIQIFSKNDLIFLEGERGMSIYFIINGNVDIYNQNTKTIYKTLGKAKSFGEIGFFLDECRSASARSDGFSELVVFDKESFTRLLADHPTEQVVAYEISRRALKDLSILGVKCYLCKKLTHIARDCKEFIVSINKEKIIKKAARNRITFVGKRVNLAIALDKAVHRNDHFSDIISKYSKMNAKGVRNREKMNSNYLLVDKAKQYAERLKKVMPVSRHKMALIEDSEEESKDDYISNALPHDLRFEQKFLRERLKDVPRIEVHSDPGSIVNMKTGA